MERSTFARRLALALFVLVTASASTPLRAQSDGELRQAREAFDRGDRRRLDALAPLLQDHVLAPYVAYWQLRLRLEDAEPATVRAFLARYAGIPVTERLRAEWLKLLARRGNWGDFAADGGTAATDDVELACAAMQYRRQLDPTASLASLRALWATGQSTPDTCEPLWSAMFASGELTDADRRLRIRLASEAGNMKLAQAQAAELPVAERIAAKDFAAVDRDPVRVLAKGEFAWKTAAGRDLALYALERAARKDAGAARAAWLRWRASLPAEDRLYGHRRIAYHAARQLDPSASEWFREAGAPAGSVDELAWRVRAALRARAFGDVLATINAMPGAEADEPAWRYWKGRALAAEGRAVEAEAQYASLSGDLGFYGLLAAEARGQGPQLLDSLRSQPIVAEPAALAAFGARPEVKRALKLLELDVRPEGIREWAVLLRKQPDEGLLLAAEFARRAGAYDRAINAAEKTAQRHDYTLRYLAPFRSEFAAAARDQGLDESLIYGIARQESRFVPDIVSSAGAVGLMQLMPGTARWVAGKLGRTDYTPAAIANVPLNTQFGAYYFRYWHDRLDQRPALAAAAYNAGPSRAQSWRPAAALEGAIWVETIPFNETRDYVKKVLANSVLYARMLGHPYVSLTDRHGVVTPRGADAATLAAQTP
jgi:soluble lytic murein transglycosylase